MNKVDLQQKLENVVQQHTNQTRIRDEAQLAMNKLAGAFEVIQEMIDNYKEDSDAASKPRSK